MVKDDNISVKNQFIYKSIIQVKPDLNNFRLTYATYVASPNEKQTVNMEDEKRMFLSILIGIIKRTTGVEQKYFQDYQERIRAFNSSEFSEILGYDQDAVDRFYRDFEKGFSIDGTKEKPPEVMAKNIAALTNAIIKEVEKNQCQAYLYSKGPLPRMSKQEEKLKIEESKRACKKIYKEYMTKKTPEDKEKFRKDKKNTIPNIDSIIITQQQIEKLYKIKASAIKEVVYIDAKNKNENKQNALHICYKQDNNATIQGGATYKILLHQNGDVVPVVMHCSEHEIKDYINVLNTDIIKPKLPYSLRAATEHEEEIIDTSFIKIPVHATDRQIEELKDIGKNSTGAAGQAYETMFY